MGKLHTLRRAILRNPNIWINKAAWFSGKEGWKPSYMYGYSCFRPYYNFVQKVLLSIPR